MASDARPLGRGLYAGRGIFTLRMLREAVGLTQGAVSEKSGIHVPDVSKLEARDSLDAVQLSTLRRYVAALGGDAELVVVLNGRRYRVSG